MKKQIITNHKLSIHGEGIGESKEKRETLTQ